ncbi:hypothetical protein [Lacticaseibacillus brantae]|uniref:hypothetical protein n=1 Tax=Lacticaseibacillus brantae TaxID=943673 RepID=UPI00070AB70C|nr:hypothetical protein [Lacticaseibacillus brantae]
MNSTARKATTKMLSNLVARRLTSNNSYWSAEVNFDKNTKKERRIDFVSFKPYTPDIVVEPTSVELGTFACYEVKSSMADYTSGNGLTFYGDENYLVCTSEFAEELWQKHMAGEVKLPTGLGAILCPDKSGTRLYRKYDVAATKYHGASHRRRPASEMLWAICQSHDYSRAGVYRYKEVKEDE